MPIYEYQCQSCSRRTEAIQRLSDPPLETCDECGGALQKLLSAPAFQFKGSGWYVTDYARKDGANGKEKAKESDADTGADKASGDGSGKSDGGSGESSAASSSSSTSSSSAGLSKSERIISKPDG